MSGNMSAAERIKDLQERIASVAAEMAEIKNAYGLPDGTETRWSDSTDFFKSVTFGRSEYADLETRLAELEAELANETSMTVGAEDSALQDFTIETLSDAPSGDVGLDMDTPATGARDAQRDASWGTDETSPYTHPDDLPGGSTDPGTPARPPLGPPPTAPPGTPPAVGPDLDTPAGDRPAPVPLIDRKWRVPPPTEPARGDAPRQQDLPGGESVLDDLSPVYSLTGRDPSNPLESPRPSGPLDGTTRTTEPAPGTTTRAAPEPDARALPDVGRLLEQLPNAGILMGVGLTLIALVAFCGAPALLGDRSAPGVAAPAATTDAPAAVPTGPTPSPRRTAVAEPPVRVVAAEITYRFHDTYCEYQAFATWTLEGAKLGDVYEYRFSQGGTSHPVQRFVMSGELFDPATGKLTVRIGGLPDDSPGHTAELIMVRSQPPQGNGTVTAPPMRCPNRR